MLIGHSLGSVVLFDSLCHYFSRLDEMEHIRQENKDPDTDIRNRVHDRLRLFITLGSPLDIVKFFFEQGASYSSLYDGLRLLWLQTVGHTGHVRQLFRNAVWLNLWVRTDIVSGKLKHYGKDAVEERELVPNLITQHHIGTLLVPPVACHSLYIRNEESLRHIARAMAKTCSIVSRY